MEQENQVSMNSDFLLSVIKAQARTHEKALFEAAINSFDAGATDHNVTIDKKDYVLFNENTIQIVLRKYCRPDRQTARQRSYYYVT